MAGGQGEQPQSLFLGLLLSLSWGFLEESGRWNSLVIVNDAAQHWHLLNLTLWFDNWPGNRRLLLKSLMWPASIVVLDELIQEIPQARLVDYQQVVEAYLS